MVMQRRPDTRFGFDVSTGTFRLQSRGFDNVNLAFGTTRGGGRSVGAVAAVRDWRPYLRHVESDYHQIVRRAFQDKGRGDHRWPALSPNTIAGRKLRGIRSRRPLRVTGALEDSLRNPQSPDYYRKISRTRASWGSSLRTASGHLLWRIHDSGTDPYVIRAKSTSRPLRFGVAGPGGARWMSAYEVNHPGVPSRRVAPLSRRDLTQWVRWAQQYAIKGLELEPRAGFRPRRRVVA